MSFSKDLENQLLGITGKVIPYKNKPEIVVNNDEDIWVKNASILIQFAPIYYPLFYPPLRKKASNYR
jgi:hypothetical protein